MVRTAAALATMAVVLAPGTLAAQTAAPATSSRFVTDQARSELRASKFVGIDVRGSDGQTIGTVTEILMDAPGNATTVVIGVGGVLGIGEKAIAVPFASLDWVMARPAAERSGGPTEEAAYHGRPDHAVANLSRADLQGAPSFKYYAQTHPAPGAGPAAPVRP